MPLDILIGGSPSSGSTLLSVMLDSHPDIMCGPEIAMFSHPAFWRGEPLERRLCPGIAALYDRVSWYGATRSDVYRWIELGPDEVIRRLMGPAMTSRGKTICAEKSPPNVYAMPDYLAHYSSGRCVIVMRDGRDVVCSLMRRGSDFDSALRRWVWSATMSERAMSDSRTILIQYADLVMSPRSTLTRLFEFLGVRGGVEEALSGRSSRLQDDPSINMPTWGALPSNPVTTDRVGVWRSVLSAQQADEFESGETKRLMRAFGYR